MSAAVTAARPGPGALTRFAARVALLATLAAGAAGCGAGAPVTPATLGPTSVTAVNPASGIATPVRLDVPTIGASSTLVETGLQGDGTLEVPPVEQPEQASWYRYSPRPGEPGPAVLLGHVNGAGRDGVFVDLAELNEGDRVEITRADGTRAVFDVYRVQTAPKDRFPTAEVYGDVPDPELRLITCGGDFVGGDQGYADNVIAYAREVRP